MPAYTTQADLEERYGTRMLIDLTDRGETYTGQIDVDVVALAISDTEALIDSFVAALYVLPFETVPAPIPALARAIAIYTLHVGDPSAKVVRDHDQAMKTLRDIADGKVKLSAAGVTSETTDAGGAQVVDRDQAMTIDNLKGFI